MNGIYNGGTPTTDLNNFFFQEVPIYRAAKNCVTLQILQPVSII